MQTVDVGERSIRAYEDVAAPELLAELERVGKELRGVRVLHLNATPYGGGVSELLRSVVPLLRDLGVEAEWKIIGGDEPFFRATKAIHNGLQGGSRGLTPHEEAAFQATTEQNADLLDGAYDVVFAHDPQPAGILGVRGREGAHWVWRCHIDTSQPNPDAWRFFSRHLEGYDAAVFTMAGFVPPDLPIERVEVIPPAIDPLSPKNMPLPDGTAEEVLNWIGIEADQPLVAQVSRFDAWKDPLGVIAAYRLVREEVPDLQLALVGSMALDDPEGWDVYREIREASAADPLIHVFTNLVGVGNVEVNAFQRRADVVIQKSIREGFGLVVSEALWKGTPVVAGRAGGIPLQMGDGEGGYLVDSVEACATAVTRLLRDPERAARMGAAGRRRVREHFLLPRLLLNEVCLIADLLAERREPGARAVARDPVCGMILREAAGLPTVEVDGQVVVCCSQHCLDTFVASARR